MLSPNWAGNERHAHVAMVHCDSGGLFLSRAGQRRLLGFIARRKGYAQNRRGSGLQRRMGASGFCPRQSSRDTKLRLGRTALTPTEQPAHLQNRLHLTLSLRHSVQRWFSALIADHQPDLLGSSSLRYGFRNTSTAHRAPQSVNASRVDTDRGARALVRIRTVVRPQPGNDHTS
jgi:hypothetical protein